MLSKGKDGLYLPGVQSGSLEAAEQEPGLAAPTALPCSGEQSQLLPAPEKRW